MTIQKLTAKLQLPCEISIYNHLIFAQTELISLHGIRMTLVGHNMKHYLLGKIGKIWIQHSADQFIRFDCKITHGLNHSMFVSFVNQEIKPTMILRTMIEKELDLESLWKKVFAA